MQLYVTDARKGIALPIDFRTTDVQSSHYMPHWRGCGIKILFLKDPRRHVTNSQHCRDDHVLLRMPPLGLEYLT